MKTFSFNPFGTQSLIIKFDCKDCGEPVKSYNVFVPSPNYSSDTAHESQNDQEGYAICEKCEKEYEITIFVTYSSGDGRIEELDENDQIEIDEIPEPPDYELEAILSNTEFHKTFKDEIFKIRDLNAATHTANEVEKSGGVAAPHFVQLPDDLVITLRKLLFTNVITCLESYLSSAYINTVVSKPAHLKKFFETFKDFQKEKITLSQLFELKDKTKDIANQAMLKVIYHNLEKVSPMFKDTFNVIFPDFSEIAKDIEIRHDIVHRNGKAKDGKVIPISQADINSLLERIETFVEIIDYQLNLL